MKKFIRNLFLITMLLCIYRPTTVSAAWDHPVYTDFTPQSIDKVYPNIKVIAKGVIHRNNKFPIGAQYCVPVKKVDINTTIQGYSIDSTYLPQDNVSILKDFYLNYCGFVMGNSNSYFPTSIAYNAYTGSNIDVVYYNSTEKLAIFWSNGMSVDKIDPVYTVKGCIAQSYTVYHKPGFYAISTDQIWLDTKDTANVVPSGYIPPAVAQGKVTASFLQVQAQPGTRDLGPVFCVGINKQLDIVSLEKFPSVNGTTDTYYKIYFGSTNANGMSYLREKGYYYVNSKYINLYRSDTKPTSATRKYKVFNVSYLNMRSDPSTTSPSVGVAAEGATIDVYEINDNWAKVYYNSTTLYCQAKYLNKVDVTPTETIKNLTTREITDNKIVFGWDPIEDAESYKIEVHFYNLEKAAYTISNYTETAFTVDEKYFKYKNKYKDRVFFYVSAIVDGMETKQTGISYFVPKKPSNKIGKVSSPKKSTLVVTAKAKDEFRIEYSTSKNFKKYIVKYKAYGKKTATISKLKSGRTYYVRFCNYTEEKLGKKYKKILSPYTKIVKIKIK